MQKCPQCNSLVSDDAAVCPSCKFDLEVYRAESSLSPNATVALSPDQLKRLQDGPPPANQQPEPKPRPTPSPSQESAPASAPEPPVEPARALATPPPPAAPSNPPARLAYYLAFLSLLPAFPIGLAAVLLGIVGVSRARPGMDPSRRQAWIGILAGGFFGGLWAAATVYWLSS